MGYIIFLVILWLGMAWFFGSFTAATIVMTIIIIAMIIWAFKTSGDSKKANDIVSDNSRYKEIQYRPIVQTSATNTPKQITSNCIDVKKYEIYHRGNDGFCDNMNYKLYQCRAVFAQTNRKRTAKNIEAFNESDVAEQLKQMGFIEPFEIERISFPTITDAQKDAIGNVSLNDVCQYDASAILSRKYDNDSIPNPDLLFYATECHLKLSYYIGKKALYDMIFNKLDMRDKIAFFVFCVYRYTTNDRQGNLNKSPYRDLFYVFSDENITNDAFIKSMNKYSGRELRFFGTLTIGNVQTTGGSTRTIAYKTAIEFLRKHFTLTALSDKTI